MAAPEPLAREEPNIGDLPAALFGRILALAGRVETIRPSVTLVSHAWRNAFYSEPALWPSFRLVFPASLLQQPAEQRPALRTAWLAARLQLLRRVAPHLTTLEIRGMDGFEAIAADISTAAPVAHVFELLNPASLERLELGGWTAMPPRLLARFPALRSLYLRECGCDRRWNWPPPVLEAVCSMRQLTALTLMMWGPQPQLLAAIAGCLPQLQRLSVGSRHTLLHAERLTQLTALQHLELCAAFSEGMRPPAPAQLPSLQTYQLIASPVELPGAYVAEASWQAVWRPTSRRACLRLEVVEQPTSLQALLDALVPPGGLPLGRLNWFGGLELQPAAAALQAGSSAAQRLAALEELYLHQQAANPGEGMAALLQVLLPCTSQQLTGLELHGVAAQQAMPTVAQLRGLRQLQLRSCRLTHLPSGPYLEGLELLDLRGNSLVALPPQLPTTLTQLVLSFNSQLALSAGDADHLLSLPRLAKLSVSSTATPSAVLERLRSPSRPNVGLLLREMAALHVEL